MSDCVNNWSVHVGMVVYSSFHCVIVYYFDDSSLHFGLNMFFVFYLLPNIYFGHLFFLFVFVPYLSQILNVSHSITGCYITKSKYPMFKLPKNMIDYK